MRAFKKNDRGATLVVVAIMMVVLVGMAAVAIDLGIGWNERRQDQTSSDLAAVAGALEFGNNNALVDEIMATARLDLDSTFTDAEWDAMWQACTDPGRPPGFSPVTHSTLGTIDCISLNPSFVRVRLPTQTVETAFGWILGVDTITTAADTIVTILPPGGAGSFPFAIVGDASSGEICLDTGASPEPPCDTNDKGSFGNIAPPKFGSTLLGTSQGCNVGQQKAGAYLAESVALGIDHVIWPFPGPPTVADQNNAIRAASNVDECIATGGEVALAADGEPVNAVWIDTGNSTKAPVTEGLVSGGSFGAGRLARDPVSTRKVATYDLDNTPLWFYLLDDPSSDLECRASHPAYLGSDFDDKMDTIRLCLDQYQAKVDAMSPTEVIFLDSISKNSRIGTAPRVWRNDFGSGVHLREVKSFDIVYLAKLLFKNGSVFYPGEGTATITVNPASKRIVDQVTAFLLLDEMVSPKVHEDLGGQTTDTWQPWIYR